MANSIADAPSGATTAQPRPKSDTAMDQQLFVTIPMLKASDVVPPPAAEPQSPSLIVLTIRPAGLKFNGNVGERAEEAGFEYVQPTTLGMAHYDTGKEVVRLVNARTRLDGKAPAEIKVHIDPETCPVQRGLGEQLFKLLDRYAILIGGVICDGLGKRLPAEEKAAIEAHIEKSMNRRSALEKRARTVTLASGERRESGELSFQFLVTREAGSKKKTWRRVFFDVQPMHYYEGHAHAGRMVQEIVKGFKEHKIHQPDLRDILIEAFAKTEQSAKFGSYEGKTVSNITSEFLFLIQTLVRIGAGNLNPKWLEERIASHEAYHPKHMASMAEDRKKIAEQLRRGREAAKARRAAEGKA